MSTQSADIKPGRKRRRSFRKEPAEKSIVLQNFAIDAVYDSKTEQIKQSPLKKQKKTRKKRKRKRKHGKKMRKILGSDGVATSSQMGLDSVMGKTRLPEPINSESSNLFQMLTSVKSMFSK